MDLQYQLCPKCGWWDTIYEEWHPHYNARTGDDADYLESILIELHQGDEIGDCCMMTLKELSRRPDRVYDLTPRKLEGIVGGIFRGILDCSVELTKNTRDGGKDLIGFDSCRGPFLVEVKRYSANRKVGVSIVRNLLGAMVINNIQRGFLITTSGYTRDAMLVRDTLSSRESIDLELKDIKDITSWLKLSYEKYFDLEKIKNRIRRQMHYGVRARDNPYPLRGFPTL